MLRRPFPWSLTGLLPGLLVAVLPAAQGPTFRTETRTVAIYATAQDAGGRLVPDLDRNAFRLLVDGIPTDITQFSNDPQALSVALMLDTSEVSGTRLGSSVRADRMRTHDAVLAFVDALAPDDRIRVGTFGLEIAIGANLTRDRDEVERVLREEVWIGGGTPLWQALVAGITSVAPEPDRRVVLAFTNGIDTGRLPGFPGRRSNVDEHALRTGTMVYAIRMGTANHWDQLSDDLKDVAEASGGGYFDVPVDADLTATFVRVAEELRHQYLIGFVPSVRDDQVHQVEVRPTRPGLTVRARRTFIAGGPS
jgi:Ca-activated chloride channel family protein